MVDGRGDRWLRRAAWGIAACLLLVAGCSHARLPAIDPSGQSFLLPSPYYTTVNSHHGLFHHGQHHGQKQHPLLDHMRAKHAAKMAAHQSHWGHGQKAAAAPPAFVSPTKPPDCQLPSQLPNTTASTAATLPPTPAADPTAPRILVPGPCQDPYRAAETTGQMNKHGGPVGSEPGASLSLSPQRQMAPVGSEVILIGGVCDGEGYYRVREPLEWALSQGSVGHFVEPGTAVGGSHGVRGRFAGFFTEPLPELLSNNYAVSCTSKKVQVLTRGTVQTQDDVLVEEGQGWVSVTSPVEGETYVTLMAPDLDGWQQRTRTAVIQWVDGQWTLPPSVVKQGVEPHLLTTTVTRKLAGTPIAGWIVRYQILDPTATFDDGTTARELVTDGEGKASAQVVPTKPEGGTARVQVQVIRPGIGNRPEQLVIGEGTTKVTWSSSKVTILMTGPATAQVRETANYRIEVTNPGTLAATDVLVRSLIPAGFEVVSSNPPGQAFGSRLEWKIPQLAPGQQFPIDVSFRINQSGTARHCASVQSSTSAPEENCVTTTVAGESLFIDMLGPAQDTPLPVGQEIQYQVTIVNRGDRPLNNILLSDRFDPGLEHSGGPSPIESTIASLGPGQSHQLSLQFRITQPGRLCHTLEASAVGARPARATACVTAEVGAPQPGAVTPPPYGPPVPGPPAQGPDVNLTVRKTGPQQMVVGQQGDFFIMVENTGTVPLSNVQITDMYDSEFRPVGAEPPVARAEQGQVVWYLTQLAPGERQTFQVRCEALFDVANACSRVVVRGGDGWERSDQTCLPVLPAPGQPARTAPPGGVPPGAAPLPGAVPPATSSIDGPRPLTGNLEVQIDDRGERWRVGDQVEYWIVTRNSRTVPDNDVVVTVQLPPQVKMESYTGPVSAGNHSDDWRIIEMAPLQVMRPDETVEFRVLARVVQAGPMTARAIVKSRGTPEGITRQDDSLAEGS
jgi:uncharacterized repeat protein (TIGR01451 family)